MKEIQADIWDVYKDYDAICCTTNNVVKSNGELVMGAGVAKVFAQKYSWLSLNWGTRVKQQQYTGVMVTSMITKPNLVYFSTKYHWKDPSDLNLIEYNIKTLMIIINVFNWTILLPRPGCLNGGLDWSLVKPRLDLIINGDKRLTIISNE